VGDPVPHPSRQPRRGPSLEPTNSLQPGLQARRQAPELTISFTSPNTHPKTATPGDPSQATVATAHTVTGTPPNRYKPVSDPTTTATRHCSSCLSSSASAASAHSSLPQLLALLTQSALRPVTHESGQAAQISGFPGVEDVVLGSEGCEAGTSHTGVTLPTSSLCS
jgi:hypothetical protein